jgi:hypothetical protein
MKTDWKKEYEGKYLESKSAIVKFRGEIENFIKSEKSEVKVNEYLFQKYQEYRKPISAI